MKDTWWHGTTNEHRMKPGLDRIRQLLERLGNPERSVPMVHVAGTNGKGSTVAMLSAMLGSQGLRVGSTISPDLGAINERVQINGTPIAPEWWDRLGMEVEAAGADLEDTPSFFEAVTALAFLAFQRLRVDIAVVEVGLGGRYDATNAIPAPLLTVITPIAYDHMDRLGNRIEQIAGEKAAIIKSGTQVVVAAQPYPAADAVIQAYAEAEDVPVHRPSPTWQGVVNGEGAVLRVAPDEVLRVPLLGHYQLENLKTAWTAAEVLAELGWITDRRGAGDALTAVRWPGRFEVAHRDPLWVWDGAHNMHGMEALCRTLEEPPWREYRWTAVFGVLGDKPGADMLRRLLTVADRVILTAVPSERATDPWSLVPAGDERVSVVPRLEDAVEQAYKGLGPGEALICCGSLALLAHLKSANLVG